MLIGSWIEWFGIILSVARNVEQSEGKKAAAAAAAAETDEEVEDEYDDEEEEDDEIEVKQKQIAEA